MYTINDLQFKEATSSSSESRRRKETKHTDSEMCGNDGYVAGKKDEEDDDEEEEEEDGRLPVFKEMRRLRHEFEKVRLLHELIRKREKLKRREVGVGWLMRLVVVCW